MEQVITDWKQLHDNLKSIENDLSSMSLSVTSVWKLALEFEGFLEDSMQTVKSTVVEGLSTEQEYQLASKAYQVNSMSTN